MNYRPVVVLLVVLTGCATHYDRIQPVRNDFFIGRLDTAREALLAQQKKHRNESDVLKLDLAMVELAAGRPQEAERLLRGVRDRFDDFEQKSVAEGAASLITDDRTIAYPGEDYEKVLIRAMLALSNLMGDGGDASAYALQVTEKQSQIAEKIAEKSKDGDEIDVKLRAEAYKQVALGPYIRAMIAEESPLTLDDAVRARVQVANWAPDFPTAKSDLQRAQHEVPIPPGHGVLYVFTLVGKGPVKEQVNAEATQASLLIADRIISAVSPRGLPPTLAPVPIPKVRTSSSRTDMVAVEVEGRPIGKTATIVDVNMMANLQQEARYPEILGRAVARRVVKKGAIYAVKEVTDAQPNSLPSLALNVVGIAWEATEQADLRCWSMLPGRIQVLRTALPAGEHQVVLQPISYTGANVGLAAPTRVNILAGRNTYLLGNFPEDHLVGELLTNTSPTPTVVLE
ncbi:MAG TPA: hypothetical protein VFG20_03680 [Planctomycetaceae bacterium]|nr:hypothetical protein [Planctomycetaceae bacterium]